MGKKFIAGLAVMGFVGLGASNVEATRFSEEADFWLSSIIPTNNPPLAAIELQGTTDGGGLFTNTYAPTGLNPTDPVIINTVGVNKISGFSNGNGFVVSPNGDKTVYVIFALNGVATPTGASSATALFTSGKAIVMEFDENITFNAKRPTTWQFDSGLANVLGFYDLGAQEDVRKGTNGDDIGAFPGGVISAAQTNFSAINTATDVLSQGIFLFDFAGNGLALPGNATQDFQQNINPDGLPGSEGLVLFTQQTNPSTATGFNNLDEAVLNDIFNTLLAGNFSDNSGPLSTFDLGQLGDFFNEFGFSANPTSSAIVPEPATAALGLMALAGLALRGRRRQNV